MMMRGLIFGLSILILSCTAVSSGVAVPPLQKGDSSYTIPKEKMMRIKAADLTIQVDPNFAYYKNRSVESIADELYLAGYKAVHYFVVNEHNVNGPLIDAIRKRGLMVWLMTLGNGTYSTDRYPAGWEAWKMRVNSPTGEASGFTFLTPFHPDFVAWKKKQLVRLMKTYAFDGIELAESYFPEWDAIRLRTYGDVGPLAAQAFLDRYGVRMPDFQDRDSPDYYLKQPDRYKKWIDFRVEIINGFLDDLINGKDGIREARPDALVATWSLAIDKGEQSFSKIREYQGLDAAKMIERVKPDLHYFQTHWPDWIKSESELPPDYMKHYQAFVDQVRRVHPHVPLGLQADIGSIQSMVKSKDWIDKFNQHAREYGYVTWTSYEYHLGGHIYHEPLLVKECTRQGESEIRIAFNKRIDPAAITEGQLSILTEEGLFPLEGAKLTVDGHWLILKRTDWPSDGFELRVNNVKDTPQWWLFKSYPANEIAKDTRVKVLPASE